MYEQINSSNSGVKNKREMVGESGNDTVETLLPSVGR